MKLIYLSWSLGMLSYILLGVLRRSELSVVERTVGIAASVLILLLMLLAVIGTALGVMSLKRKELKPWWAIGAIVLNIDMVLTGILLLSPG